MGVLFWCVCHRWLGCPLLWPPALGLAVVDRQLCCITCTRVCWLRAAHSSTGTRLLEEAWHPALGWQPARRWRREPPAGYRGRRWRSPATAGCRCCPGSTVLGPHCGVFPLETLGTVARPGRGPPPAGSLLGRRLRCLWWWGRRCRGGGGGGVGRRRRAAHHALPCCRR